MRSILAAGVIALLASACSRPRRDDLAACKAAEAGLARNPRDARAARRVIADCTRAARTTGSADAQVIAVRTQHGLGDVDAVLAAAAAAEGKAAPRLWVLAGEAEMARDRPREARGWYARALAAQRLTDPRRAANTAARLADLELAGGALDAAIDFQHQSQVLAAAGGDGELSALMTLTLAGILLDVGDVRAAATTLATMTDQVRPRSSFYREYLATAGELDAADGRTATAAASFELCVRDLSPLENALTQLRCHTGLAALAIAEGRGRDAIARQHLDLAAGYLAPTEHDYGVDPDRAAELAWMRARVDLRGDDPAAAAAAFATLRELADQPLGAATASRVAFTIGRVLAERDDAAEAERWFARAADAVEQLRDGTHYRELRRSLPRELRAPAEALFVLRARAGDGAGALAAMERALDRDFVDQLAAGVSGDGGLATDDRIAAGERRAKARQALDRRPAPVFEPAAAGVTIIGFFAADGDLWRVRVAGGAPEVVRIAPLAELAAMVKAVRIDPGAPAARTLRQRLLPDDVLPPPDELVVIVPDPYLEGVRFAALGGSGGYLIERNPIILAPTFAMAAGAGRIPASELEPIAVVLGNPDEKQRPLAQVAAEAADVGRLLRVEPIVGAAANRAAVQKARRAKVLHVASHGSTRDDGTIISLGDGDFGTADVLELDLAPELVVVASCTSAATRPDAMWTSIAAAFLVNGSGAVVGATASIPDDVAREIVVDLHRHAATDGPVRGLAFALRAAIARGTPVRSWSAFAVLGRPPRPEVNP